VRISRGLGHNAASLESAYVRPLLVGGIDEVQVLSSVRASVRDWPVGKGQCSFQKNATIYLLGNYLDAIDPNPLLVLREFHLRETGLK
jgi:hypothetical protein